MKRDPNSSVSVAYNVLKHRKRAMSAKEIIAASKAELDRVLKGKTPRSTLNANIINEINRRGRSNREQRFVRVSRGKWGLTEYMGIHYDVE